MSDQRWKLGWLACGWLLLCGCRGTMPVEPSASPYAAGPEGRVAEAPQVAAADTARQSGSPAPPSQAVPNGPSHTGLETSSSIRPVGYLQESSPPNPDADRLNRPRPDAASPEEIPPPPGPVVSGEPGSSGEPGGSGQPLELSQVVDSVIRSYPLLRLAMQERQVADGKQLAAWGEFDLGVKAFSISGPLGFYDNYRNGLALEQPTFGGGYLYGGYKLGRGTFQPWYKERQTNDGGEFALGFGAPLLKNRAIDERRAKLFDAELARGAVEPAVQAQVLDFVRLATQSYWTWVASGQVLEAREELLRLAQARVDQIEQRVLAGDVPTITRINNDQLIAARETKVIESRRKLQMAAIKLSLFWRAAGEQPIVPPAAQLPKSFPAAFPPNADQVRQDIAQALASRPELVELELAAERTRVELAKAENSLLPKLDLMLLASKDVGARATKTGDKTPFELEAGLYGEVPVQRREARGKIQAAQGKLAQIQSKREFVMNKITAEVQDALSALQAAYGGMQRAETNLRLARQTMQLGRQQFDAGDISLVDLNIYEQATTDAQFLLIAAHADFFIALADYRAALALDPRVDGTTQD
jgi:outer membrane protein TolC